MEQVKSNRFLNLSIFFTTLLLIIFAGFYKTYLVHFPQFQGFRFEHHFHGTIMLIWMLFLIVQPVFIKFKLYKLHRFIGKTSLIIAPILIISIFAVARTGYHKSLLMDPPGETYALLSLSLPAMLAFGIMYYMAIFNSRNMRIHMRYMIGTSFLMIGPGLGRIFLVNFNMPLGIAVHITNVLTIVLALVFLLYDIKKRFNYSPFLTITIITIIMELIWVFRYSDIWQLQAKSFADFFY